MTKFAAIAGLVAMYALACALPVQSSKPMPGSPGIAFLALPFMLFPYGFLVPFWWANPLFFGGCLALQARKNGLAAGLGVLASVIALVYVGKAGFDKMGPGAWLWMISMFALTAAGIGLRDGRVEESKPGAMDEL